MKLKWVMCLALLASTSVMASDARLVVAGGGLTEIVYSLGAEDQLVGVDSTSQYPEAAKSLPGVGYMRALSTEGILSLKPDVILLTKEAGPGNVLEVLEKAGVTLETVDSRYSVGGLVERIRRIGRITNKEQRASELVTRIKDQYKQLQKQNAAKTPRRVLFLLTHGGRSPMAAGQYTAADAIIRLAGAENVIDDFHGYRILSQEAVAVLNPDFIVTTSQGLEQIGGAEALLNKAGINLTAAAQQGQLIDMDALYLLGFAPRVVNAASELSARLESAPRTSQLP